MKISVISGSTRSGSKTLEVSEYLAKSLKESGVDVELIDLNELRLPLYDDDSVKQDKTWLKILPKLQSSDGFIFASPEWDGMFSVGLHNLFYYTASATGTKPLAHKPVLLVGVSSGMGGAYPIAQMKSVGQKNNHFVVIPENLRFAQVGDALVDGEIVIQGLKSRTKYSLKILVEYAKAIKVVRDSESIDLKTFASGV
ncbi:MAG: NAD(P)H-dependent oxidoreductase [bacterium]|nr:NAD(P)H-dependent oxidoreductase [bacterium]